MLNKSDTHITLEMSGDTKKYLVSAKQGDKSTRRIVAKLLNEGIPYEITDDAIVVINMEKPDGKHIYNACTYTGSEVIVELTNQALAVTGTATCDIEIRTSDNSQVLSTVTFEIEIEKSKRNENAIVSSNEYTELERRTGEHIKAIDDEHEKIKAAESKRVQEENARVTAETARAGAESKRVQAENARATAETARAGAESKREQAESARATAETARAGAESKRVQAENARVTAETARAGTESKREQAESVRTTAETARVDVENKRVQAESARATAETARAGAESKREQAESARATAETARAGAESKREQAESARATAETARAGAESKRVQAESTRATAETTRQQNETTRNQQEQKRQKDTTEAVKAANSATQAATDAKNSCNSATERAESALQNQTQLTETLNSAIQIQNDVTQKQSFVEAARKEVAQNAAKIDELVKGVTPETIGAVAQKGDTAENVVSYTSNDAANPDSYTDVDLLKSGETHKSVLQKISTMFKNIRYLYKMLGSADISGIGDGSVKGALSTLNSKIVVQTVTSKGLGYNFVFAKNDGYMAAVYNSKRSLNSASVVAHTFDDAANVYDVWFDTVLNTTDSVELTIVWIKK